MGSPCSRKRVLSIFAAMGVTSVTAVTLVAAKISSDPFKAKGTDSPYRLTLTSSFLEKVTPSGDIMTFMGNGILSSSDALSLSSRGEYRNKKPITGIESIEVTLTSGSISLYFGNDDGLGNVYFYREAESLEDGHYQGYGDSYFKIVSSSDAAISSISIGYRCDQYVSPFAFNESGELTYRNDLSIKRIMIPSLFNGVEVKKLAKGFAEHSSNIEEVYFPATCMLDSISANAFRRTGLKNVILPSSVTILNPNSFCDAPIESVYIPTSVSAIYHYSFTSNLKVYWGGTAEKGVKATSAFTGTRKSYFYSEKPPASSGNYWHWDNGKIMEW